MGLQGSSRMGVCLACWERWKVSVAGVEKGNVLFQALESHSRSLSWRNGIGYVL